MNIFYFNECIGEGYNIQTICSAFEDSIIAFRKICNNEQNKLVFEKDARKIVLAGYPLENICRSSKKKDFRTLIYSYLMNYPLAKYIQIHQYIDEDAILQNQYSFENQDATNLAIAYHCDWIAFSLPLSPALCKDRLELTSLSSVSLFLDNFYGDNIETTEDTIREKVFEKSNGLEKLKALAKNVEVLPPFVDAFEHSTSVNQKLILERFEYAKRERVILSEQRVNDDVVVNTIPKRKYVEELRVVNPIDIRVYFHQVDKDSIIVASMNYKNRYGKGDQNNDIESAENMVKNHLGIKK